MSERATYTLEEFRDCHGLDAPEAARLFERFGPYRTDLDLLVAKKREYAALAARSRRRPVEPAPSTRDARELIEAVSR